MMSNTQIETAADEGLERLERFAPEFAGFLSNHGPMVIEALTHLGREDAIPRWLTWYEKRLEPRWPARERVTTENWHEALGDRSRFADWVAFFESRLAEASWAQVVGEWASRLAPGLSGSATHGVIRAGHAVRALASTETPQRLRELANALAYWAASFLTFPEAPSAESVVPSEAVALLPSLPADQLAQPGWEKRVAALPEFASVLNLATLSGSVEEQFSALTETFAGLYLANAALPGRVIIPIHAVTSANAVRRLLPFVEEEASAALVRYAWQAGAAITTAFAVRRSPFEVQAEEASDWNTLIDIAVSGRDEHAIKFTEACLSEYELTGSLVFYAAAADAVARLSR